MYVITGLRIVVTIFDLYRKKGILLPKYFIGRWMILQWVILTVIPPVLDFGMDYFNGIRSLTGNNLSRLAWSLSWAMFINILITPMMAATVHREERIERLIAKVVGNVLKNYVTIK